MSGVHPHAHQLRQGALDRKPRRVRRMYAVTQGFAWGMVRRMFAHSIQNWWWTAHPAAH
ncbi:trp operon leader peptide [Streptomyces sp. NPDC058694]|uniref:trp operon leader peptide n=1 Tax=Streptomyces sp. NPDC058694 TaxID=3346603 RepID=UPI003653119D